MENLVKRAKAGDSEAFSELMIKNENSMYKVARAILGNDEDAGDAMQDTVLICWEKIKTLRHNSYFRTWMTRILINRCIAILDNKKKEIPNTFTAEIKNLNTDIERAEWKAALNCLDEKYRILIVLYYIEGYKIREISKILDIKETTVKDRMKAAKKQYYERIVKSERSKL